MARNNLNIELLTDAVEAFRFDFQVDSVFPSEEKTLRIPVRRSGRCLGIIQWIRIESGENLVMENDPLVRAPASSWQLCAYTLPSPLSLEESQIAVVSAAHNRKMPWFSLERVEAPSMSGR